MTDLSENSTEREALTEQDRLDISAVVHQNYHMPDVFAVAERIIARHHTPTPHVVTTGEELAEAQSDSDWGYVAVRDAEHRPWIVWDTEQGDFLATSFPTEDDVEHIHGDQHRAVPPIIDARDIPLPATVLTPAPAPVDREARVKQILAVIHHGLCACPDVLRHHESIQSHWLGMARAALDASEGVSRG